MLYYSKVKKINQKQKEYIMIEVYTKTIEKNGKNFNVNIEFEEECKNQYNFIIAIGYEFENCSMVEGSVFDSIQEMKSTLIQKQVDLYNDIHLMLSSIYKSLNIDENDFGSFQCNVLSRLENYKFVNTLYFWSCYKGGITDISFFEQYKNKLKENNYYYIV